MAQQTINVGAAPNDGTGTPLRTAFQYTNSNFSELYTAVGPSGNNIVVPGTATITGDLTVDTSTLKVDSANNRVGIGTASPASPLDVYGETRVRSGNQLRLYRADNVIYSSLEDAGGGAGLTINNANGDGFLIKVQSNDVYRINSSYVQTWYDGAGGTRMTLNSTGLGVGVVPSAGKGALQLSSGINFPATQVASSDANTLDDYEEGTWTPVVADASTGGNTGTCTINSAKYVKIGRQVSVQCDISGITTTGMTAGNVFYIRGLPFTSVQGGNGNFYTYRVGRNASTVSSSAVAPDATSHIVFSLFTTNSATTDIALLVSDIVSTTSQIILSVTYFV